VTAGASIAGGGAGSRWLSAWPDALAFAAGLAVAWFAGWSTTDLVWSLWLASLVVGYAMIVWMIFSRAAGSVALWIGGLFLLAFFTVHFGMFHFAHSVFLRGFFPVGDDRGAGLVDAGLYAEVVRRYWLFVPVAALAERAHFRLAPPAADPREAFRAFTDKKGGAMMAPYKNVIRLHLLIFFFAFAHFLRLDSFVVYAVVYAVHFFPWRLLREEKGAVAA
jgi:hypothetical protein